MAPTVVEIPGNGYRMYYTHVSPRPGCPQGANDYGNATSRILSATSVDGADWNPEPGVRLSPQQGGAGEYRVVAPEVVPIPDGSGRWRMYYECCPGTQAEASTIRSAVSADRLKWTVESGDRLTGSGGSFNAPRVLALDDGRCRMYCSDQVEGIVSAISEDDGYNFTLEAGRRIVRELPYEAHVAYAPEVLRIEGGGYRMYYAGYADPARAYVLSAASDDGLTWQKHPEPVISPGGPFDRIKCSEMGLATLPGSAGYRLFYEACDGTTARHRGVWRILSASA
ncbi:MAG: hypothetical protein QGI32_23660 [Candidatus Latescibacteria bacterium]|nr:hypothetical protein [Candidatus Latescibacterota bacterium]